MMSYKIFKIRRTIFIFCILSLLLFFALCMKLFSNEKLSVDETNKLKQQMIDESIANYPGKCACPYQIMSNGKRCGKFSAYSKPGGYDPLCYFNDITENIIASYQGINETTNLNSSILNKDKIRIVDGDTIVLNSKKIRFHGIDAPEKKQKCKDSNSEIYFCGLKATDELKKIIGANQINCKTKDKDRYGRFISVCFVNGKNINALLVEKGWALAYRKYSNDYIAIENKAKKNKLGLWSGSFKPPWIWRQNKN